MMRLKCPRCGLHDGARIQYGLVNTSRPALARALARREVVPGGCVLPESGVTHRCPGCGHEWRWAPAMSDEKNPNNSL